MNNLRNRVQLLGNVGNTPKITKFDSGKVSANLSLATSYKYADRKTGEIKSVTDWHNLVAWGKTAELIEKYVSKGKEIMVEGRLTSRSYEDKEGNKRYTTEVLISNVVLLRGGKSSDEQKTKEPIKEDSTKQEKTIEPNTEFDNVVEQPHPDDIEPTKDKDLPF